ncbi:tRNA CCA-pyrophosphorylase [Buchnera aphidicola]|uniref:CCA-adding enzyme n=1 Tax=Buchnera aphidicola subsp. Cinara cedri (strain Cc) TaxID=372461 RepID=CCA_BUCCC|nr:tRNA CCA-pyrophosphorylase [Buchnera aphidicola]Q058D0.1 RecName: Full=CCA-adding enzyme; AltName: Full=CCA tRNA nucleotidyltransferase; AltName: Full=tRNA CCA-pyrophosphorylase; AltName: Full=tRNA adenylyl-/cytidylyl- transferase; AltName: Full=tRNA nucleotidyltransferase; AltName: Full=tRNA-NT [Buchnera aphidicola BCc]ABJ90519.1 tRNA nucleotidyltransferase [Buchnera aphidicola BCc]
MKIYLVGGAIRDRLLNIPVRDRDWVVVGIRDPKEMLKKNYQQVGKGFPVFIHPKTHEEYSLARTEKKNGVGHTGFLFDFSSRITLKEDLKRRDLTINAIAQDSSGKIIDFFNGKKDIQKKILRHVSYSFQEDPLRVLRIARFAALLSHLGFYIAKKTLSLMKLICSRKELLYLTPERIWKETQKGLSTQNPHVYFQVLYSCNALFFLFPEINYFYKKTYFLNSFIKHINLVQYSLIELSKISKVTKDINIRFSYFLQFFYYVYPIPNIGTKDYFFYKKPAFLLKKMLIRLKIPKETSEIIFFLCGFHNFLQNINIQSSKLIIKFFNIIDVWRKPNRLNQLIYLDFYNFNSLKNKKNDFFLGKLLKYMFSLIKDISVCSFIKEKKFKGIEIKNDLNRLRIQSFKEMKEKIILNIF